MTVRNALGFGFGMLLVAFGIVVGSEIWKPVMLCFGCYLLAASGNNLLRSRFDRAVAGFFSSILWMACVVALLYLLQELPDEIVAVFFSRTSSYVIAYGMLLMFLCLFLVNAFWIVRSETIHEPLKLETDRVLKRMLIWILPVSVFAGGVYEIAHGRDLAGVVLCGLAIGMGAFVAVVHGRADARRNDRPAG